MGVSTALLVESSAVSRISIRGTRVAEEKIQARRFLVSGMVQGVGYRFFAQRAAGRIGVAGYVKNLHDGRVEVYAIGRAAQLAALHAELERGPRMASVERVQVLDDEIMDRYRDGFVIEHGWL
jgi:acylphosphatase